MKGEEMEKLKMPVDWDNHQGWENYFAALPSDKYWYEVATKCPGSFHFDRLGPFLKEIHETKYNVIWFPGCGFSPLPRIFASFGFTVYATDISSSAIQYQNNNMPVVEPLFSQIQYTRKEGVFITKVHDFRTSFGKQNIDIIFNVKAIQGLPLPSMKKAILSHYEALRPGGTAFFDTMNVQGIRREELEDSLVECGFYIPLYKLQKNYRKALSETGIPYVFILGEPVIPQEGEYSNNSPKYKKARALIDKITEEYYSRIESEFQQEQKKVDSQTKHAELIYSTG